MARFIDVLLPILGGLAGASSPQAARGLAGAAGIAGEMADRRRREQEDEARRTSSRTLGEQLRVELEKATGGQLGPYDRAAISVLGADPAAGSDLLLGRLRQIQGNREDEAERTRREQAAEAKRVNDEAVKFLSRPPADWQPGIQREAVEPIGAQLFDKTSPEMGIFNAWLQTDPEAALRYASQFQKQSTRDARTDAYRDERDAAFEERAAARAEAERLKVAHAEGMKALEAATKKRDKAKATNDAALAALGKYPQGTTFKDQALATWRASAKALYDAERELQRLKAAAPMPPSPAAPAAAPTAATTAYAPTPEEVRRAMR